MTNPALPGDPCPSCGGRLDQNQDRAYCPREGKKFDAVDPSPWARNPAKERGRILEIVREAGVEPAHVRGFADEVLRRLRVGAEEYGPTQYLEADCDLEAHEEALDIVGWLSLGTLKLKLLEHRGEIDASDRDALERLWRAAMVHAIKAYALVSIGRQFLCEDESSPSDSPSR